MDVTLPITVREFKENFVDSAEFYKDVRKKCSAKDITIGKWSRKGGTAVRDMAFLHPVKVRIPGMGMPSHAPTSKKQILTTKGDKYIEMHEIDEVSDIPFCTHFQVHTVWKISEIAGGKCKVEMTVSIEFNKGTMFEGKIVKNTYLEATIFVEHWLSLAKSWICKQQKKIQKCKAWDSAVEL